MVTKRLQNVAKSVDIVTFCCFLIRNCICYKSVMKCYKLAILLFFITFSAYVLTGSQRLSNRTLGKGCIYIPGVVIVRCRLAERLIR